MNANSSIAVSRRVRRSLAAPLLAMLVLTSGAYAFAQQDTQAEVPMVPSAVDTEQAAKIASAIQLDLSKLAPAATVEDLEASIFFVLSQGEYSLETMEAALDIVEAGPNVTPTLHKAIDNVRLALRRRFRRGTAAIPGGTGDIAPPSIVVGGGGSNYGS